MSKETQPAGPTIKPEMIPSSLAGGPAELNNGMPVTVKVGQDFVTLNPKQKKDDDQMDPVVAVIQTTQNGRPRQTFRVTKSRAALAESLNLARRLRLGNRDKERVLKLKAAHEYGDAASRKLTCKFLAVGGLDSLENIVLGEEVIRNILTDAKAPAELKLSAIKDLALLMKARREAGEHIVDLLEKGQTIAAGGNAPKIGPALMPTQINMGANAKVMIATNSDNSGQKQLPSDSISD